MPQITPDQLFPGITVTGTAGSEIIGIPLAILGSLTAVEADPTTGDGMELAFALDKQMFKAVQALPPADRPTQATLGRTATLQASTDPDVQVTRYTHTNAYDRTMPLNDSNMEVEA